MKKLSLILIFTLVISSCASINSAIDSIHANPRFIAFQEQLEKWLQAGKAGSGSEKYNPDLEESGSDSRGTKYNAEEKPGTVTREDNSDTSAWTGSLMEKAANHIASLFQKPIESYQHNPETMADVSVYRSQGIHPRVTALSSLYNDAVFKEPEKRLPVLVTDLLKDVEDPFEQVKILHDWVARHIRYDFTSFLSGNIPPQDAFTVARTKKSVCEGYSNLFSYLADQAGIPNTVVHGYARGAGYSIFRTEDVSDGNHAWNAVKIGENWYLLDVTWDSGYVDGNSFVRKYSTAYLFIAPEHMIYTHFPENQQLQLLDSPVSADSFTELPHLRGDLFLAIPDFKPPLPLITESDESFRLDLPVPEGLFLIGELLDALEKKIPNRVFIQKNPDGMAEIHISFPQAGNYILCLYAGTDVSTSFNYQCEFGFSASSGSRLVFPLQYSAFHEEPYRLISPVNEPVIAGANSEFSFYLPGVAEALLYDGKNRYALSTDGDSVFSISLAIPTGISTLNLVVRKEGGTKNRYEGLLSFPVQK